MAIEVICANCGKKLKAPDEAAGRKGRCPGCGQTMRLTPMWAAPPPLRSVTGSPPPPPVPESPTWSVGVADSGRMSSREVKPCGLVPTALRMLSLGFVLVVIAMVLSVAVVVLAPMLAPPPDPHYPVPRTDILAAGLIIAVSVGACALLLAVGAGLCVQAPSWIRADRRAVAALSGLGLTLVAGVAATFSANKMAVAIVFYTGLCVNMALLAILLSRLLKSAGDRKTSMNALLFVTIMSPLYALAFMLMVPSLRNGTMSREIALGPALHLLALVCMFLWFGLLLLRTRKAYSV